MDLQDVPTGEDGVRLAQALSILTSELVPLVRESRSTQEEMVLFRERYRRQSAHAPLPPRSLDEIRRGTRSYLDLQDGLTALEGRSSSLAAAASAHGKRRGGSPALARRAVATALAIGVTLYDNFLAMLPLFADRRFRRLVNHVDLGYGIGKNELWDMVELLNDRRSRWQLSRLVTQWERGQEGGQDPDKPGLERLNETIASSATYYLAREATLDRHLPTALRVRRERILDGLAQLGDQVLYVVSEGFGNAIGQVELRKGKLWQREDVLGHLQQVLQPLDLLLEKTPFRLTDLLIPGHFGHVAIWMGRPRRLKRIGVWKQEALDEARIAQCRPLIQEGRGVLEALRSGVELNALRVFANVDDLAVIRPKRLKRKEILASLVRGFQQVGKKYDFGFDVETTDTIVCSELPYHVYSSIDWRTEEQMGRFTITPDDVAQEAIGKNPDFGLVAFYHDGALVPSTQAKSKLRELVR